MDPFAGRRVLELGRGLAVASAGLALTALGADTVQGRVPGRVLPEEEAAYYDRGRRTVAVADLEKGHLGELPALADVILTDLADGELEALGVPNGTSWLRAGDRPQVLVALSSLGRSGPHREFRMTDLTEWASSGLATVTRRPQPSDSPSYTPVLPPGCQPQALAGLAAATAAVAGEHWARVTHEPVVADVSVQEVSAAVLHGIFPPYVWNGIVIGNPASTSTSLGMLLPAADGDVYIRTLDPRQWEALMEWVDDDAVRALGAEPDSRLANNDALCMLLGQWTVGRPRMELLVEGQRRRVPIALPRSLDDVLAWQHLRARGVWRSVELDGRMAEAPRLPLLEPVGWRSTAQVPLEEIAGSWGGPL